MTRRGRPPATWEAIDRPEGGWLAPGVCGRPHLIGGGWGWWNPEAICPGCLAFAAVRRRRTSLDTVRDKHLRMLNLFYPDQGDQ